MCRSLFAAAKIKTLAFITLLLISTDVLTQERGFRDSEKRGAQTKPFATALGATAKAPSGSLIVFEAAEQIYIMNPDGSNAKALIESTPGVRNRYPALSPDGTRVAFVRDEGLGDYALYSIGVDGKGLEWLMGSSAPLGEPAWSPDGSRIAFIKGYDPTTHGFATLTDCNSEIFVLDILSGKETDLTQGAGGTDPTWSPDGTRIAFSSARSGNYDIYMMDSNGGSLQQLTSTSWAEAEPTWSPDGLRIAYVAHLTQATSGCGFMPTGGLGSDTSDAVSSIYLMSIDGTNQSRLAGTTGTIELAWSPLGTQFALALKLNGGTQIYLMDIWSRKMTKLTSDSAPKSSPVWGWSSMASR